MEHAKCDLRYLDPETNEKYTPYVIEPSVGVDRLFLAILNECYKVERVRKRRYKRSIQIKTKFSSI